MSLLISVSSEDKEVKFLLGAVIGALFSGVLSAVAGGYITLTSNTTVDFAIKTEDFWWLAMILGAIVGAGSGAVIGGTVCALDLSPIKAGVSILLITIILALFFYPITQGKFDTDFMRFGVALVIISVITGIVLPFITPFLEKPK